MFQQTERLWGSFGVKYQIFEIDRRKATAWEGCSVYKIELLGIKKNIPLGVASSKKKEKKERGTVPALYFVQSKNITTVCNDINYDVRGVLWRHMTSLSSLF